MSRYQKGKTNLDFTEARDSEWQWHQLGHMHACTSLQTDNHTSIPPLSFLQAGCPSCQPTNSVKALEAFTYTYTSITMTINISCSSAGHSAATLPATIAAVDRRDIPTDRQMSARPLHRPCTAYYAGSISEQTIKHRRRGLETHKVSGQLTFRNTEICFVLFFSGVRDDAGESCSTNNATVAKQ